MAQDGTDARWRPVATPAALVDLVTHLRALDPTARLAGPDPGVRVDGVTADSRTVAPGDLFAALPGAHTHGVERAGAAARAGAVALFSDRPADALPTVLVRDPRALLGPLAAWLLDHPADALAVHGVTGTNGKSSTTSLLAAALAAGGRATALSGTLGVRYGGVHQPQPRPPRAAPRRRGLLRRQGHAVRP